MRGKSFVRAAMPACLALLPLACAGLPVEAASIASFTVGSDETLSYPSALVNLPDEHTTFMPMSCTSPLHCTEPYLVFGASSIKGGSGGAVVLETSDLVNFDFATDRGYADQVMTPPVPFTQCDPTYDVEFDENYAAPGTVVQDPTRPPGHLIMIYEAENHCPGGVWQQPFYATVGFARSADGGITWPAAIDAEFGGRGRRPVLKLPAPEPASEPMPAPMGNALPSALVRGIEMFVVYTAPQGPGAVSDGLLRIARANLANATNEPGGVVRFRKWDSGGFSQPGLGGADTGFLPSRGCTTGFQAMADLSFNDELKQFLLVYVCASIPNGVGAWYYATATSLALQDWTDPQMVLGSQFPLTAPCPGITSGAEFDGWYPSLVSPGAAQGHTKAKGRVFFLNGCDTGMPRAFMSRRFSITLGP